MERWQGAVTKRSRGHLAHQVASGARRYLPEGFSISPTISSAVNGIPTASHTWAKKGEWITAQAERALTRLPGGTVTRVDGPPWRALERPTLRL